MCGTGNCAKIMCMLHMDSSGSSRHQSYIEMGKNYTVAWPQPYRSLVASAMLEPCFLLHTQQPMMLCEVTHSETLNTHWQY